MPGDLTAARAAAWTALVLLLLGQVYLLYVVAGTGSPPFPHADKVGHMALFAVPALVAAVLRSRWAVGLIAVHAVVAEPLQGLFTTTRVTDPWDAVANVSGLLLGLAGALVMGGRR